MKLTNTRGKRRKEQRRLNKIAAKGGNPVAGQVLMAIEVLEKAVNKYFTVLNKEHKMKAIPEELIYVYTGKIVHGMKPSRDTLNTDDQRRFFDVCVEEIEKAFAVFGASCKKYCQEYATVNVPREVIGSFFKQMRDKVMSVY